MTLLMRVMAFTLTNLTDHATYVAETGVQVTSQINSVYVCFLPVHNCEIWENVKHALFCNDQQLRTLSSFIVFFLFCFVLFLFLFVLFLFCFVFCFVCLFVCFIFYFCCSYFLVLFFLFFCFFPSNWLELYDVDRQYNEALLIEQSEKDLNRPEWKQMISRDDSSHVCHGFYPDQSNRSCHMCCRNRRASNESI